VNAQFGPWPLRSLDTSITESVRVPDVTGNAKILATTNTT